MKFANKQYKYQKKALGERQATEYIKMAYLILAEDRIKEQDMMRDQLYGQYMMLYNDMVMNGNTFGAKGVLDSMAKIFLNDERKIDLSVSGDQPITINFGFNKKDGD